MEFKKGQLVKHINSDAVGVIRKVYNHTIVDNIWSVNPSPTYYAVYWFGISKRYTATYYTESDLEPYTNEKTYAKPSEAALTDWLSPNPRSAINTEKELLKHKQRRTLIKNANNKYIRMDGRKS